MNKEEFMLCCVCGKGMAAGGMHFYRIHVDHMALDFGAIRRRVGLELMMGGSVALADTFTPDTKLAQAMDSHEVQVCAKCALDPKTSLATVL